MKNFIKELSNNEVHSVAGGMSENLKEAGIFLINTAGPIVGFVFILRIISSLYATEKAVPAQTGHQAV